MGLAWDFRGIFLIGIYWGFNRFNGDGTGIEYGFHGTLWDSGFAWDLTAI